MGGHGLCLCTIRREVVEGFLRVLVRRLVCTLPIRLFETCVQQVLLCTANQWRSSVPWHLPCCCCLIQAVGMQWQGMHTVRIPTICKDVCLELAWGTGKANVLTYSGQASPTALMVS